MYDKKKVDNVSQASQLRVRIGGGGGLIPSIGLWELGGVDSARGVAAIVICCRNSSCNSSCDAIALNG